MAKNEIKAQVEVAKPAAKLKGFLVRARYGEMLDTDNGKRYTTEAAVMVESLTPWLECQRDAGKLEVTEL